jgi:hypothetical protein
VSQGQAPARPPSQKGVGKDLKLDYTAILSQDLSSTWLRQLTRGNLPPDSWDINSGLEATLGKQGVIMHTAGPKGSRALACPGSPVWARDCVQMGQLGARSYTVWSPSRPFYSILRYYMHWCVLVAMVPRRSKLVGRTCLWTFISFAPQD